MISQKMKTKGENEPEPTQTNVFHTNIRDRILFLVILNQTIFIFSFHLAHIVHVFSGVCFQDFFCRFYEVSH